MIAQPQEQSYVAYEIGFLANSSVMDGLSSDAEMIRALVDWTGLRPANVAKKAGVAHTTINRAHKRIATTRISAPTLDKLRAAFPQFPGFAVSPDLPLVANDPAYVDVSVLPSYAGMGGGGSGEGDLATAKLPRRLIEEDLRGKPSDFELIDVRGDSMEPDFQHGDQILVDRRDRDPRQPGPFALFDGDGYVVKLVERVPQKRGWYRVFSANGRYSAYEIEEHETTIMGRPVWFARRL